MPDSVMDDNGARLAATWHIEADEDGLVLVMESSSGRHGTRPAINPDYNAALTVLLARLGSLDSALLDAVVDSRQTRTRGLTEAERRLEGISYPVRLADVDDMEAFRRQLSRAQSRVGQGPDAAKGGNATKQIRLRVDVSWAGPADANRLEAALSGPVTRPVSHVPDAAEVLGRLLNVPLSTVTGRRNTIVAISGPNVMVATERSPDGQPVPVQDVQVGLDRLFSTGEVEVSVPSLGHRSSFVGAVLRMLSGAVVVESTPPRIQLANLNGVRQAEPAGERSAAASGPGGAYRQAQVSESPASRDPFSVDPALVERGLRGHADTQNELARVLLDAGIEPRSPMPGEPNFDLAWQNDDIVFVAEVKSITDANEEEQLRLGLGQVLRYRQRLGTLGYQHVVAVLVPEREPRDPAWKKLCSDLGVVLLWRGELERALILNMP